MNDAGTIRAREAKDVVKNFMAKQKVSPNVWSISGGHVRLIVGDRLIEEKVGRGMSFYGLEALLGRLEAAIAEMDRHRDKRQIDIEDYIKKSA